MSSDQIPLAPIALSSDEKFCQLSARRGSSALAVSWDSQYVWQACGGRKGLQARGGVKLAFCQL